MNHGLGILARSLGTPTTGSGRGKRFQHGNAWQYHPRSDRHSKIACWAILFDLLRASALLREHVTRGIGVGVNHPMTDFAQNRTKNLDLVVCSVAVMRGATDFASLTSDYAIVLTPDERQELANLPRVELATPATVRMALEAKACMTEFGKARPRLYDELNSSHITIHGDTTDAIAAGFVMVNAANTFLSPLRNPFPLASRPPVPSMHNQPADAASVLHKVGQLPRRSQPSGPGFDALGITVVECRNDGSPVSVVERPPFPTPGDPFHYDQLIHRLSHLYAQRFPHA